MIKILDEHKALGHPLATASLLNNLKLLWQSRGVRIAFWPRAMKIFLFNFALLPFRRYEIAKWRRKVEDTSIKRPPLFILGHWRCGTTFLHNLFALDPRFGYVSTLQAFSPELCIEWPHLLWPIFRMLLPRKRPMDNMDMSLQLPQEEEYALANMGAISFYLGYYFPQKMKSIFHRLLFLDALQEMMNHWQRTYLLILKKATLVFKGNPLVIKNPLNMIRIPILLNMFPGAKFVHIYRNPYRVYYSTFHTFKTMTHSFGLQRISDSELEENTLYFYAVMMERYWQDSRLIPSGNLCEVKFEAFERDPAGEIERIYAELQLPSFAEVESRLLRYLKSQQNYRKNIYAMNEKTNQKILERWGAIIERLGYE
ncbi:MAG: sulfotransferase [Calditrichaeota bacterium]|nr:MAG: sulfotransferase [Calditrichota bacterium]